tara:strand:- start:212 stop:385 length:174 start_codon:yes stop_codon:yes gene_type:complete
MVIKIKVNNLFIFLYLIKLRFFNNSNLINNKKTRHNGRVLSINKIKNKLFLNELRIQ